MKLDVLIAVMQIHVLKRFVDTICKVSPFQIRKTLELELLNVKITADNAQVSVCVPQLIMGSTCLMEVRKDAQKNVVHVIIQDFAQDVLIDTT